MAGLTYLSLFIYVTCLQHGVSESEPVMFGHLIVKRSTFTFKTNTAITGFSEEEKTNIVTKHNEFRKLQNAANMEEMEWNSELETKAQGWADQCRFDHNPDSSTSQGQAGENIALRTPSYNEEFSVESWYNETVDYDYATETCSAGAVCGHYTQVVWASSDQVGCGIKYCPTLTMTSLTNAYIIVCNYLSAGNFNGQKPFVLGAACSQCPGDKPNCNDGLCSSIPQSSETQPPQTSPTPTQSTMGTDNAAVNVVTCNVYVFLICFIVLDVFKSLMHGL